MTKLITNVDEVVEIYFESGSARIRFKEGVTPEFMFEESNEAKILASSCTSGLKLQKD